MPRSRAIALVLAVVTLLLYGRVVFHGFVNYDDLDYVTGNRVVQAGLTWNGVLWAFTTRLLGNWHPVTWLSHMLDCQLYGLWAGGHHLSSVLLHVANTLLLFRLLRRLTGEELPSALVAALFAWHPLHVESVAWVAERKDVLSALFWLLALDAYVSYVKQSRRRSYGWALAWFAVGLMAKPMLVTLPLTLLLLDFWPLNRFRSSGGAPRYWPVLREKLPFFVLTGVSCGVTLVAQQQSAAVATLTSLSVGTRLGNALLAYGTYLKKLCWPRDLAVIYPLDTERSLWIVAGAAALLVALTLAVLSQVRRRPWLGMGWFWFLITLVPVIGLVQVGAQSYADRYTYVPAIGCFIVVAWLGQEFLAGAGRRGVLVRGATAAVLAACVLLSALQLTHWQDSVALFRHAVAVTRGNFIAENSLGHALMAKGEMEEAARCFESVLRLRPDYYLARHNLAICLMKLGKVEEGVKECERLIEAQADYAPGHHLLGMGWQRLGRTNEAIAAFEQTTQLAPQYGPARVSLGLLLAERGDDAQAVEHLAVALRIQESAELYYRRGNCLLRLQRLDEAIASYRAAVGLDPKLVEARNNLASALVQRGDRSGAMVQLRAAVQLQPEYAEARLNLASLLGRDGKWSETAGHYEELLKRQPENASVHFDLAMALLNQQLAREAISHLREALRLQPGSVVYLNALARALATTTEPELRHGEEAVLLAERACELGRYTNYYHLDTLALAQASAGHTAEAVRAAERAVAAAEAAGKTNLAAEFGKRLKAFRSPVTVPLP